MPRRAAVLILAGLLAAGCTGSPASGMSSATQDPRTFLAAPTSQRATAGLLDKDGKSVGFATFAEDRLGVRVELHVFGLPEGKHGAHVHAAGKCEGPAFESAGGHFNPAGKVHGTLSTNGPHAGDLGNLVVKKDGTGILSVLNPHLSLAPGASANVTASGGLAIVVHAQEDDERTDPSGNSGGRIACGIIKPTV